MGGNVQLVPSGQVLVAFVKGEVDELTAPSISERLIDGVRREDCAGLVIDLRDVSFIASTGLSMLLRVRKDLLETGAAVHLLCAEPSMPLRLLRITQLDELFPIHTDLRDALAVLDSVTSSGQPLPSD